MTKDCKINMSEEYDNILFKNGLLDKNSLTLNKDRKQLFLSKCIPIRVIIVLIGIALLYFLDPSNFKTLDVILFATIIVGMVRLTMKIVNESCAWWSSKLELLMWVLVLMVAGYSFYNENFTLSFKIMIIGFVVSILSGITQMLVLKPFEKN